ncbi:MAG: hypothetical protein JW791_00090 [Nanoarchaeota archaeon]|nr:hypothetical protein [Nanoarchaeota archaeon]
MKKQWLIICLVLLCGCTGSNNTFEQMRITGLIPSWESGFENYFDVSTIVSGGSGYYNCVLGEGSELPNGVTIGGYNGCEVSGTITLNPGTSKLITPPFNVVVIDEFGNELTFPVSLTITSEAPLVYGNYFECVVGQSCSERLVEASGGTTPYTYRLGSLTYGAMPPGTSVGVDGYLTGTPTTEGEYSFEVCVIDVENIISCGYPSINVVGEESELGKNPLYSSGEISSGEEFSVTLNSAGSSTGLLYINDYESVGDCDEFNGCFMKDFEGSSVSLHAVFDDNTYFVEWRGVTCEEEWTDNFNDNDSVCYFTLTKDVTATAVLNKRPTVHVNSVSCTFDHYDSRYPDIKIWGYYTFSVSGTASAGSTGSVLSFGLEAGDSNIVLNCGSWTQSVIDDELICVMEAGDSSSTSFSYVLNNVAPQGYLLPFGVVALVEEADSFWVSAIDNSKSAACPYE